MYDAIDAIVRLPHLRVELFFHPLLTSKPATMTQNAQTTILLNRHKAIAG